MYQYIKLRNRLDDLYNRRFQQQVEVREIGIAPPTDKENTIKDALTYAYQPFKVGDSFTGRDKYYWLKVEVDLPKSFIGKDVMAYFDIGRTGLWFESGMESLLYVKGMPYQAVDRNHKEVLLTNYQEDWSTFYLQVWSGLEGGGQPKDQVHTFKSIHFSIYDKDQDKFYLQMKHLLEAYDMLGQDHAYKGTYEKILVEAYKIYNQNGVKDAIDYVEINLEALTNTHPTRMNCIAHTHIDLAWLWRTLHSKEKGRRSFYTVLRMMEEEDFYFFQSQPQLYAWIEEKDPVLFSMIKEQVAKGNWEIGGGMWVEADLNISGGESLARQILHGERYLRDKFDYAPSKRFLWLPDVFGYNWSMPQLLKSAGIDYFFTTKMSWNEYEHMPYDTFTWKGMDGSEVLCHFITTPHPYGDRHYVYNALVDSKSLCGTWDNYKSKLWNNELLVAYGYGDGGGGANIEMVKSIDITNKIPTLPKVESTRIDDYIEKLEKQLTESKKKLPVWFDELYLQFHRGTYTTQGTIKKWNRLLENTYRSTEILNTLGAVHQGSYRDYDQEELERNLKVMLTNQFHDILPGSSIREVNDDAVKDYASAFKALSENAFKLLSVTSKMDEEAYSFFSPLHKEGNQLVLLQDKDKEAVYKNQAGDALASQITDDGTLVFMEEVKPFACTTIYKEQALEKKQDQLSLVDVVSGSLSNDHYNIRWNKHGQLTEVYDKELDKQLLLTDECANVFQVFEDKPHGYEAWEIELDTLEDILGTMEVITDLRDVQVVENGPLMTSIRFQYGYGSSEIIQQLKVYKYTKRIDFSTEIDWQTPEKLLKTSFPLNVFTKDVCCDIQFGNIKRPTHGSTAWDTAKFEICAINWVDVSQRDFGVSLLNDGKYGHDVVDSTLRLSLLKSSVHPDIKADIGKQSFTYSLFPHKGDHLEGNTHDEAFKLNNKAIAIKGLDSRLKQSLFNIEGLYVHVDAIKKAEDSNDIILRLHEYGGGEEKVVINSVYDIESYCHCSILEEDISEWVDEEEIAFSIKPFEIVTLKIKLKNMQEV